MAGFQSIVLVTVSVTTTDIPAGQCGTEPTTIPVITGEAHFDST